MKRILLSAAEKRVGLYWFEGVLFDGIGFERGGLKIVHPFRVQAGKIVAPYLSICEAGTEVSARIDLEGASGDYEPVLHLGDFILEPFSGMGFEFKDGICTFEGLYCDGAEVSTICWSREGRMSSCTLVNEDFTELYEWFSNEQLKSCTTQANSRFGCDFVFLADGSISYLRFNRGMLDAFDHVAAHARFFPVADVSGLGKFTPANGFRLSLDGVDRYLIGFLDRVAIFQSVETLFLRESKIDEWNESMLAKMVRLKEVVVEHVTPEMLELGKWIKGQKPQVRVSVGRMEV